MGQPVTSEQDIPPPTVTAQRRCSMIPKENSEAYQSFQSAMKFSMTLNDYLHGEVQRIETESREAAIQLLSLIHTFGLLTVVWAFESFLTTRCIERFPEREEHWRDKAGWEEMLEQLIPPNMDIEQWRARIESCNPRLYFKARNLWCHGVGMRQAVQEKNRPALEEVSEIPDELADIYTDDTNYYQDSEGRLWVRRKLWRGCAGSGLPPLAEACG